MLNNIFIKLSEIFIDLVSATIILFIGIILGRTIGKVITKSLNEVGLNSFIEKEFELKLNLERHIGKIISYLAYAATLYMVLKELNITRPFFYLIIICSIGLVLVSLIVSIKDFFPNLFSGFKLMKSRIIKENNSIIYDNINVKIINIGFLETKLQTKDGDILFVPNAVLAKKRVKKIKKNN